MSTRYALSLASLLSLASAAPYSLFPRAATGPVCSASQGSQLSCHNTNTVTNTCCFNSPGGQLLQTQFWDASPAIGPATSWTLHGLWPDNCDGTYEQYCDASRESTDITGVLQRAGKTDLLSYMNKYWLPDSGTPETFWEHEWNKHGTCISTLEPACYTGYTATAEIPDYFEKTVSLFKGLDTYSILAAAGITPSTTKTYALAALQSAITTAHGKPATLNCQSGSLNEVWYHFNVYGSAQTGRYVPADPIGTKSTCPSTGIRYLPKSAGGTPTTTGGTGPTSTAAPGTPFSGRGYLNVSSGGCIISAGKWYTSGTCATFTAAASGSGFTLTSSKGPCSIASGAFTCAAGTTATVFSASGSTLLNSADTKYYADAVASGQTQQTVYTSSTHSTSITITWQSL